MFKSLWIYYPYKISRATVLVHSRYFCISSRTRALLNWGKDQSEQVGMLRSRKSLISALIELRKDPTVFQSHGAFMNTFMEQVNLDYKTDAIVLISAANAVSHALSKNILGRVEDASRSMMLMRVNELIVASKPYLSSIHSIHIARCFRAARVLIQNRTDDSEETINTLIEEASRPIRLASYSATDLSELIHSTHQLRRLDLQRVSSFQTQLVEELISRESFIKIKNEINKKEPQSLSTIGVSNILFATRQSPNSDRLISMFCRLLSSKKITEAIAIEGSNTFHLVSILDSLLRTTSPTCPDARNKTQKWKAVKRILPVIVSKRNAGKIPLNESDMMHIQSALELARLSFPDKNIQI